MKKNIIESLIEVLIMTAFVVTFIIGVSMIIVVMNSCKLGV